MMDITLMSLSATVYNGRHEPLTVIGSASTNFPTATPAKADSVSSPIWMMRAGAGVTLLISQEFSGHMVYA